jgi:glycosyltransferase involved in cell wall biosynthesis
MSTKPRLSIGLPVYNGEDYLAQSIDAVLGQTYTDFELVISSNASTDGTDDICRDYEKRDSRITFFRQDKNIGAAPNHDFVFQKSRGELFKWASGDDLWARDLVARCIALLDEHPDAILAHTWTAAIDGEDNVIQALEYPLATDSPEAPERLRSMLFDGDLPGAIRADDFYGVIRSDVLRKVKPHDSYYHADQVFMAEVALHGRFLQVPEWLYFRRHHDGRALQANPTRAGPTSSSTRRPAWSRNTSGVTSPPYDVLR